MFKNISVGDLVMQRSSWYEPIGLVLDLSYGRSKMPKNEPDTIYEYAAVQWTNGTQSVIKTGLLEKIS
jgi:hypothetical protein|tara:strand:+ start:778 stop:981 length:204 start_codon:yes stop_codon:yes gene_type:complete